MMDILQNHPTSRSCPHKQAGTFRNPFEMGFICNNKLNINCLLDLSINVLFGGFGMNNNKNYKGCSINFFRIFPSDLTGSLDDFYLNSVFRGFCL